MPSTSKTASTWADYLLWRRILWVVIVLGPIPAMLAWMLLTGSERVVLPLAVWGLVALLVALKLQRFRCPRCNHHFFPPQPLLGLMARRCVACMLPKE